MNQGYTKLSARLKGFISADKAEIFIGRLTYCDWDKKSNQHFVDINIKRACEHKVQIIKWNILVRFDVMTQPNKFNELVNEISRKLDDIVIMTAARARRTRRAFESASWHMSLLELQRRAFNSNGILYATSVSGSANNPRQRTSINSPWSKRPAGRPAFRAPPPACSGSGASECTASASGHLRILSSVYWFSNNSDANASTGGKVVHPWLPIIQTYHVREISPLGILLRLIYNTLLIHSFTCDTRPGTVNVDRNLLFPWAITF